jgi:hypothetical protein
MLANFELRVNLVTTHLSDKIQFAGAWTRALDAGRASQLGYAAVDGVGAPAGVPRGDAGSPAAAGATAPTKLGRRAPVGGTPSRAAGFDPLRS